MKKRSFRRGILLLIIITLLFSVVSTEVFAFDDSVYLGGFTLGFDLSGEGALIVGLSEVVCDDGVCIPAKDAGLKSGDYILSLNGKKINKAEDIDEVLEKYDGKGIIAEILSDNQKQIRNIFPKKDISGKYKFGILVRDYLSGLGTVTFVTKDGEFYSLGHPITDEEGKLLKVSGGNVYCCNISDVEKGTRGHAGELKGDIIRDKILGTVYENSAIGLTGKFTDKSYYKKLPSLQCGLAKQGVAEIYATIDGMQIEKYSAAIIKADENDKFNKNLVIKITDRRLIESAGGIVRGMSGSPIVQNGKIVGAVTHVFLNDSTRGYGISIARMLSDD